MKTKIEKDLFDLQDLEYKKFQCALMPTVVPDSVIGVRMPELRKYAGTLVKNKHSEEFINDLPHTYYEENNLHGIIISSTKDFKKAILEIERFLPYVDNWATCDLLDLKIFESHKEELYVNILEWIKSDHTYTARFGIKMLMSHFLDEGFKPEYLNLVVNVRSDEYYVNMMRAWYFATALAKQYKFTVKLIEREKLDIWTHNKTIQKAIESYRITDEQKAYLRTLRRKEKRNA